MELHRRTLNQNVIEKHDDYLSQQGTEDIIYGRLERRRHITKPKRHNLVFVMAIMSAKRGFGELAGSDGTQMLGPVWKKPELPLAHPEVRPPWEEGNGP